MDYRQFLTLKRRRLRGRRYRRVTTSVSYTEITLVTDIEPNTVTFENNEFVVPGGVEEFSFKDDGMNVTATFDGTVWNISIIPKTNIQDNLGSTAQNTRWGLNRISQRDLPMDGEFRYEYTGKGVRIYVMDTGCRVTHNEFEGRYVEGVDTYSGDEQNDPTIDTSSMGHGTRVAGVCLGATVGVAKKATLVPVRIREQNGVVPDIDDFVAGFDWILNNNPSGVRGVIVISVPTYNPGTADFDTINAKALELVQAGFVICKSAGNQVADSAALVSEPYIISVGSTNPDDSKNEHSNDNEDVTIYAPTDVLTSSHENNTDIVRSWAGTSFATPHAAGVAAIYLEANPTASPAKVMQFIIDNSTKDVITGLGVGSHNRLLYSQLYFDEAEIDNISSFEYLDELLPPNIYQYRVRSIQQESEFTDWEATEVSEEMVTISGIVLHLDASDEDTITKDSSNLVSEWQDKSGQGNHVSQTDDARKPTYVEESDDFNGKPALSFDNDVLQAAGATPLHEKVGGTIIHVAVNNDDAGVNVNYPVSLSNTNTSRGLTTAYYNVQQPEPTYDSTLNTNTSQGHLAESLDGYGNPYEFGKKDLRVVRWAASDNLHLMRVNGKFSRSNTVAGDHILQAGDINIGSFSPPSSLYFKGTIVEVMVFDRLLTDDEIKYVELYLMNKWMPDQARVVEGEIMTAVGSSPSASIPINFSLTPNVGEVLAEWQSGETTFILQRRTYARTT